MALEEISIQFPLRRMKGRVASPVSTYLHHSSHTICIIRTIQLRLELIDYVREPSHIAKRGRTFWSLGKPETTPACLEFDLFKDNQTLIRCPLVSRRNLHWSSPPTGKMVTEQQHVQIHIPTPSSRSRRSSSCRIKSGSMKRLINNNVT